MNQAMTKSLPLRLSVAAPVFNEGTSIGSLITHWIEVLRRQPLFNAFELVVCNDGSTDDTAAVLDDLAAQHPELRVIHWRKNQGAAAALATAIAATQWEWVLLLDADGQFPIENVLPMVERMRESEALAVIGVRQKQDTWFARFGSKASGIVCNYVHGSQLRDFNSACKLVQGDILRSLRLEARGLNYSTDVTSKLLEVGCPIVEIDIDHRPRNMGKSKRRWGRDSVYRLLFVGYIALRQLLLKLTILRCPVDHENGR
jgi:dolichol-phosphate mannosyltransferase